MRSSSQQDTVVVKRQRRRQQEEEKGGAWKVAFADFTMAMMSLFLVLWILAISEKAERRAVAENLRNYSVLEGGPNPFDLRNSPFPIDFGGNPGLIDELATRLLRAGSTSSERAPEDGSSGSGDGPQFNHGINGMLETPEQLTLLGSVIDELARALTAADNLAVEVVPQGLRIVIKDDNDQQMFERGSVAMTPFFERLLMQLAPVFVRVENPLIISGHTDTVPYHSKQYSNWELSGDRALMARRVLEAGGMPKDRVAQVVAMSDRVLADKSRPDDSANRRIEILLLTKDARQQLFDLFDRNVPGNAIGTAARAAASGAPPT
jgi:chemotaxis protein MotB